MTIQDFILVDQCFKLTEKGKAVYDACYPFNLWPKRTDGQYINHVLIQNIKPYRTRWGIEAQHQKLLPLETPAFPI